MTNQQEKELTRNSRDIEALKVRIENVEEKTDVIQGLMLSVQRLTSNIEKMVEEQTRQSARLEALEKEPMTKLKEIRNVVITAVGTFLITWLLTYVFK